MKSWHHGLQTLDMIARATTAAAVYCRTASINKKKSNSALKLMNASNDNPVRPGNYLFVDLSAESDA